MRIFKKRRGYWPMGERFAAFFRGPTIPPEKVTLNVRPNPDPRPVARKAAEDRPLFSAPFQSREYLLEEAAWLGRQIVVAKHNAQKRLACGDFHPDKDLPDYCEGCTQPKGAHSYEALAAREAIQPIPFKEPSPELMNTLRDIERAREDFWKMAGANNLNVLKGIGEMPHDYFNTEKPT
jgi:hypothetical protein